MGQIDTTRAGNFTAWEGLGEWSGQEDEECCFVFILK